MRIPTARLIFCLAACGLAASCSSSSGPDISAVDKSFLGGIGSYDLDHDGTVTCDEWRTAAGNLFTRANKSGSGYLSEDGFQNLVSIDRTFLVATFKYYDVNGDGKIDRKEFVERPNPAFTYADKDKDCRLNDLEQATARNISAPPQSASRPGTVTAGPSTGPAGGSSGGY
jgi:Ca2+-binding EF-hand superfamily protein